MSKNTISWEKVPAGEKFVVVSCIDKPLRHALCMKLEDNQGMHTKSAVCLSGPWKGKIVGFSRYLQVVQICGDLK